MIPILTAFEKLTVAVLFSLAAIVSGGTENVYLDPIPEYILEDWERRTQGTGVWITDNTAYQSENEPYDAYGLHWEYGIGKMHLKGRLYGLIDGKEAGTFWQFTEFWDPATSEHRVVQISADGTVGQGLIWQESDGRVKEQQTFTHPDKEPFSTGHRIWMENGNQHVQSYNIIDDEWQERRFYIWERQEEMGAGAMIETPEDYKGLEFFIGEWVAALNDTMTVTMSFRWAENRRMIYYRSTNPAKPGQQAGAEAEGVISYHGVKDQLVFMNSYLREGVNLMSEGYYDIGQNGVIERHFIVSYKEGHRLPWSDGNTAPAGGARLQFKQIWTPIDENSFQGDFFWMKDGEWKHPIKEYDDGYSELWRRVK